MAPSAAAPTGWRPVVTLSVLLHAALLAAMLRWSAAQLRVDPSPAVVEFMTAPSVVESAPKPLLEPAEPAVAPAAVASAPDTLTASPPPVTANIDPEPAIVDATPAPESVLEDAPDLAVPPAPEVASSPTRKPVAHRQTAQPPRHLQTPQPPALTASLPSTAAAPAPTMARPAAVPSRAVGSDPSWHSAVVAWLAAHKRYPEAARQNGEEGAVGVRFMVARDGRVGAVEIPRPSGVAVLDHAVRDMLQGQTLPPFPPDMAGGQTEIVVTIRFTIER